MTACQKIKKEILIGVVRLLQDHDAKGHKLTRAESKVKQIDVCNITDANIDELYGMLHIDLAQDAESEFRHGEVRTNLPCEGSQHYESDSVAAKLIDGSWVGWTRWYGGGKHGDPGSIDWMSDAYDLDVAEEEKLVIVRTWKKRESR